jgi:RHS repeat-associated protein
VAEGPERRYAWDHAGRLGAFAGSGVTARHLYDSGGSRVCHLARRGAGSWDATLTIDGGFERRRAVDAGGTSEETLVHVLEGDSRVAIARTRGAPAAREVEYHLADHLGSASLVLDAAGAPAGREEYFPFGETSLGGLAGQRHRFTGRERDEESLLSYHGARFYAPWLGRWVSREPLPAPRLIQGASPFAYARGNPMRLADVQGTQEYQPRPHLPLDGDPVPTTPDPEFPPWFTEDQKKAFIDQHNALGADRAKRDLDPATGDKNLPYDPYLPSERRAMVVGEVARQLLILALTSPVILGRLFGLGAGIRLGAGESMAAASVTAEESLAAHLTRLEAEGVNVQRQGWVHVSEGDALYGQVVNHGGAFQQNGRIYVNMDVIGGGVVDAELGTALESRQVLQHELGHLGQPNLSVARGEQPYLWNAQYHAREANASANAAAQTANEVDRRVLLEHANANLARSREFQAADPNP